MYISLDDIKRHLIIETPEDDLYLAQLENAACEAVRIHCNVPTMKDLCDEEGYLNDSVRHAVLLLIGTWYANREGVTFGAPHDLPAGFEYLISLNQTYYGGTKMCECR